MPSTPNPQSEKDYYTLRFRSTGLGKTQRFRNLQERGDKIGEERQ
jgi:hypothetical protein